MYQSFFKFEKPPFKLVADPSMLFASRSVGEALSRIEFAVRTGKGIAVMTGEVGTGKTTLVNRFLDKAGPNIQTAYIFNPTLSGLQLLRTLADEFGIPTANRAKVDLTRAIYEVLLRNRQAGQRTVVFVDEAQVLSREALEELRLISNLETWQEKLLHIVLVGQPELLAKLESFGLRQLRQRVELFIQIEPMKAVETRQYIEHRLRVANPLREVGFTDGACQLIHRLSGGIPREINKICDAALLVAYVDETGTVTTKHVREAVHTIDAQQVSIRLQGRRHGGGLWQRLWGAAAAVAALVTLMVTFDSAVPRRSSESALAGPAAAAGTSAAPQRVVRETPAPESGPATLVHLASFRERPRAEIFASRLGRPAGLVVYLQSIEHAGQTWHRVLLGNFEDLQAASAYASSAQENGTYTYAQAVRVPRAGLLTWDGE